jgi:sugar porter (SP) family MFS transporter
MLRLNIFLWSSTAALAGFLFGFDTAVISGAERAIQATWQMDDNLHGLAISAALWGTVIGALLGNRPSDSFGRKPTLIAIGLLYLISALGSAFAWDSTSFMIFRFVGGLGVGASSVAAPTYISEISPKNWRGRLVALFQTMIVFGILIAFLSNFMVSQTISDGWRVMLGIEILPAIIFLIAIVSAPESPRWLAIHKGDRDGALTILKKVNPDTAEATLAELSTPEESKLPLRRFLNGGLMVPISLAVLIAVFNQVSGINAIIYYAPRIFELTGAGESSALLATAGVGVINLIFTLVGLALIDKIGRKTLMYIGSLGYIVSLSFVAYGFASEQYALVPIFIFAFIASHAIGQGAVIWVYISEIFPNAARASGQALGASTHWVLAAGLTLLMPGILASVDAVYIFSTFAALMILQLIWVHFMMVETRGRALEEVARDLSPNFQEKA